jgi:hypothetical protein
MSLKEICIAEHKILCLHVVLHINKQLALNDNSAYDDRSCPEVMS